MLHKKEPVMIADQDIPSRKARYMNFHVWVRELCGHCMQTTERMPSVIRPLLPIGWKRFDLLLKTVQRPRVLSDFCKDAFICCDIGDLHSQVQPRDIIRAVPARQRGIPTLIIKMLPAHRAP